MATCKLQIETTEVKDFDHGINSIKPQSISTHDTKEDNYYPNDRHLYLTSYYGESLTMQASK